MTEAAAVRVLITPECQAWLDELHDERARRRIAARLVRLRGGNVGDARSVGSGVSELRIDHGPGYRLYFARRGLTVYVVLLGGDKSTQARDIARAHVLAAELGTE